MAQTEALIKTYQILFIGDTSVGKTNLISRFVHNKFSNELVSTICVEQTWTKVEYKDSFVQFEFNDTASQEYLRSNIDSYYEEAECYVIVFDMTKRATFNSLNNYFDSIYIKFNKPKAKIILVGNKMDLSNKEIKKEEALDYAKQKKVPIYFTSAKANTCIKELFSSIYKAFISDYVIEKNEDFIKHESKCDCCIIY